MQILNISHTHQISADLFVPETDLSEKKNTHALRRKKNFSIIHHPMRAFLLNGRLIEHSFHA